MVYFDEIAVNYECCLTIKATLIRIAAYCKAHCYDMGILIAESNITIIKKQL